KTDLVIASPMMGHKDQDLDLDGTKAQGLGLFPQQDLEGLGDTFQGRDNLGRQLELLLQWIKNSFFHRSKSLTGGPPTDKVSNPNQKGGHFSRHSGKPPTWEGRGKGSDRQWPILHRPEG